MTDKMEDQEGLIKNRLSGGRTGFVLPCQLLILFSDSFNVKCRNRF